MKMKLVLANNQSKKFVDFHQQIQQDEPFYDYVGYQSLLFEFNIADRNTVKFTNINNGRTNADYEAAYLNGYLNTPEIAYAVATVLDSSQIPYVNKELSNAPSLSKLTMYAKLAASGVKIPHTFAGTAYALLGGSKFTSVQYPAILKRADADRGIDNFMVKSHQEMASLLEKQPSRSLWILQDFIPNDGFYLVSMYLGEPEFGIFRTLEERPDGNELKAHMFKPKGGANAHLLEPKELPNSLVDTSIEAIRAMNRQIASVDSIYDEASDTTYVLEVNYNPQLVTIETFKDVRQEAFLRAMQRLGDGDQA